MCLTTKTKKVSIAEDDIVCYKVVMLCSDGEFSTPFQKAVIPNAIISGNASFWASGDKEITYWPIVDVYTVGQGYIHTYEKLVSAVRFCKSEVMWEENISHASYRIFECRIPKGTEYYAGCDDLYEPSFASEKITFKTQIR